MMLDGVELFLYKFLGGLRFLVHFHGQPIGRDLIDHYGRLASPVCESDRVCLSVVIIRFALDMDENKL